MKITIELNNIRHTVETKSDDQSMDRIIDLIRGLLVSAGFHPETVDCYFDSDCQWFPKETDSNNFESNKSKNHPPYAWFTERTNMNDKHIVVK